MIVIVCISMCACVSTHHIMFACVYIIFLSIGSFVLPCLLLFFFRTFLLPFILRMRMQLLSYIYVNN